MNAPRLLWITPPHGSLDRVDALLAQRAATPGLALLLRRPSATPRTIVEEARKLMRHGVPLLVQRCDLALAIGAAGVHLPERGLHPREARSLHSSWIIGASRHDVSGLQSVDAVVDYATLSPFASVEGKGEPLGAQRFAQMADQVSSPILALGGIDASTSIAARQAGAHGFAFIRAGLEHATFDALRKALDSPLPVG